jgi:hypothetical protein
VSDVPTKDEVVKSIEPKADQINADDLLTGHRTFTIAGVRRGSKEQPIQVDLVGETRAYRPCKSMRRVLIAAFGDDPKEWVGKRVTLFCDKDVAWAGVKVGGIRISHLSGLSHPHTFLITHSRGKRSEMTILPLADVDETAQVKSAIGNAKTKEELKAIGAAMKSKPKEVQDAVRANYVQRQKDLTIQKTPLELFFAEIEAAKDSKQRLSELTLRCDQFDNGEKQLEQLIETYYATAKDDLGFTK